MLTTEWNIERARVVWEREAREDGLEEGRVEGIDISTEIVRELLNRVPAEEIAVRYKMPVDKIRQFQAVLPTN